MANNDSVRTVDLLRNVADFLRNGGESLDAELEDTLNGLLDDIDQTRLAYQETSAPEGTEAIRDLMLETLSLSECSIQNFLDFLQDGEPRHLDEGVAQIEEADDILGAIEDLIQQSKERMGQELAG